MSLFDLDLSVPSDPSIKAKIRQRRAQMLIHSSLYYDMDESIVSDHVWQKWADELETLQREHPDDCKIGFFDKEFSDWTGATGNHLPHRQPWVHGMAKKLLKLHERFSEKN